MPAALYTAEDHAGRFDAGRFGGDMRNATVGGYGNGYDINGSSGGWNAAAFAQNGAGGSLHALGAGSMRKPNSRGRTGLPNVSIVSHHKQH